MDGLVLGAEVHRGLLKRCDPAIYLAALDTFKSPVVARMLRLETTPGNAAGALDGSSPGPPERVALFRRLDRAQHHTQFLVDLSTSMVAVMSSVLAGQTPSQAQVDSLRNQMHQRLQPLLLAINAAVYRSVSDEELTQYVTVWESSPLRQYNAIYQRVLADVMTTQSRIVDEDLKAKLEFYRPRTAAP
jgi:hypothetical protein